MAIRFDLASIPEDEDIISATLDLFVGGYNGNGYLGDYAIYRLSRSWIDTEADWNNAAENTPWTNPGGDFVSEEIDTITHDRQDGYVWRSFNVLEAVKYFIANPDQNFGFLLKHENLLLELDIASSDYEIADWRPKMTIEHTIPESALSQKRIRGNNMRCPVILSVANRKLHVVNNGTTPARITLSRLDGTTVASEIVSGGMRKVLSAHSPGVYFISVFGDDYTLHEKVSLFH